MTNGPMGKAVVFIAYVAILTVMMIVATIPSLLALVFLVPEVPTSITNALVIIAATALLGPALSAGIYAARARTKDETPEAAKAFWRGYRMNFLDVMRIWFPASLVLGLLAFGIAVGVAGGLGFGMIALVIIAFMLALWAINALVISTFIHGTSSDIAKLAVYYIGRQWRVALGILSLIIVAGGIVAWLPGGVFALAVAAGIWVIFLYEGVRPMIADVTQHYSIEGAAPHDAIHE
jgi:hypothetical protein